MTHHGASLRRLTGDGEIVSKIQDRAFDAAPFTEKDRALVHWAIKLTSDPGAVTDSDIEALKSSGFDESAIHDACQVIAYFNYVNRIADGLGVELEG